MQYRFEVMLTSSVTVGAESLNQAEMLMDGLVERLIVGSELAKEYPDSSYTLKKEETDKYPFNNYLFDLEYKDIKVDVEANSFDEAEFKVPDTVMALVQGSKLKAQHKIHCTAHLSEDQPGLDDLLSWIDEERPFAIAADASMYHIECAKVQYGEEAIELAISMSEKYSEEKSFPRQNFSISTRRMKKGISFMLSGEGIIFKK